MFGKYVKVASLAIVLCIIAVMFFIVTIFNGEFIEVDNPTPAIILLLFAVVTTIPIFAAHEKHN